MTTSLKIAVRASQGPGSSTRYQFNATNASLLDIQGEELCLPAGCRHLVVAPRLCGDFYAELQGNGFYVSAVAKTPARAVAGAIAKATGAQS